LRPLPEWGILKNGPTLSVPSRTCIIAAAQNKNNQAMPLAAGAEDNTWI